MRRRMPAKPDQESLVCMMLDIVSVVVVGSLAGCCLCRNDRFNFNSGCSIDLLRRVDREGNRMQVRPTAGRVDGLIFRWAKTLQLDLRTSYCKHSWLGRRSLEHVRTDHTLMQRSSPSEATGYRLSMSSFNSYPSGHEHRRRS